MQSHGDSHGQPQGEPQGLKIDMIRGEDELTQFGALLDSAFGVSAGAHYLDDFPVWDERYAKSGDDLLKIGVFSGNRLVSSTAIRAAELRVPESGVPTKVAIIGAVATHSEWRGRGLASKTVALALDWAQAKDAAMAVLWGSEHSLYGKLGFLLRGKQSRVPLRTFIDSGRNVPIFTGWTDALFTLLRMRSQGIALRDADLSWIRNHKNVSWYWTGSPERPTAYAAFGKGIDLAGLVHEWGGDRNDLFKILALIGKAHPQAELLGSPDLLTSYGILPPDATDPLCLAKVLKPGFAPQAFWFWGLDSA